MYPRFEPTDGTPVSLRPTEAELEHAFVEIERKHLPLVTRVLAIFYATIGVVYLFLFPRFAGLLLLLISWMMGVGLFGISEHVRRHKLSARGISLSAGLVSLAVTLTALASMHIIAQPTQIIGAVLLLIGLGVLVVSVRWYVLVVNVTVLGWLVLIWRFGATPAWLPTLLLLSGAVFLSVCIFLLRRRIFRDLERTRLYQLGQQEKLERTLREQERIQNELRETETRFRTLVEQLPAATYVDTLDSNASTLYISPQIETITGYTAAEWIAKGDLWSKSLHPDDRARALEMLHNHQETGEQLETEYRLRTRDARWVWIHDEAVIVQDEHGIPVYSQGYMTDITERKQAEDALRRRDAIFEIVRYAAETFLRAPSWEDRVERVLARLGAATQVNRVHLDENTAGPEGTLLTTQRYEWCAQNTPARTESQKAPFSLRAAGLERWEGLLGMGLPVYGIAADLPEKERTSAPMQGIESLALMPVFVGREWWGIIWLEVCDRPQVWAPMELDALQAAANTLGAAIQRRLDERAVAAARDMALEASRLKSEFLAMMSHEIRTPMNTIVGMSELLLESPLSAEQREFARSMRQASDVLLTIINDILDFSKIEAGRLTLEPVAFDLRDLIAGTAELLAPTARSKGLQLQVQVDADVPQALVGDAGRLRQVLINLLSNAIKFTSRGQVDVRVAVDKTAPESPVLAEHPEQVRVVFTVSDTGIGISSETQARLFQPFMQGDMSITRRYGGTGLGLAISRRLLELMGGEIDVQSIEGQGSTFRFWVPLLRYLVPTPGQDELKAEPLTPDRVNGLVLLAEDNKANRKLGRMQLQLLGIREIEVAATGRTVLNAVRNGRHNGKKYALILMDCQMPEMDGFAATRAIRQLERGTGQHVPIVALTASAMEGDKEACQAAGMDDYLVKPLRLDALRAALNHWLPQSIETASSPAVVVPLAREIAQDNTAPIDFRILKALRELEGPDTDSTRELAQAYLDETQRRVDLLTTALDHLDIQQVRALAHSIRGSSASFGAQPLANLANEIELCVQDGNTARVVELLPTLRQEFERVSAALRAEAFVS